MGYVIIRLCSSSAFAFVIVAQLLSVACIFSNRRAGYDVHALLPPVRPLPSLSLSTARRVWVSMFSVSMSDKTRCVYTHHEGCSEWSASAAHSISIEVHVVWSRTCVPTRALSDKTTSAQHKSIYCPNLVTYRKQVNSIDIGIVKGSTSATLARRGHMPLSCLNTHLRERVMPGAEISCHSYCYTQAREGGHGVLGQTGRGVDTGHGYREPGAPRPLVRPW